MMRSSSHLLAGHPLQNNSAPRPRVAELIRPAIMMPPPVAPPPTSPSSSTASPSPSPSPPPPPFLFDAVVSAFFEQLRNSEVGFNESQHWRMVGTWQEKGIPNEVIFDTLEALFPFHGSPLTLYEEVYLPALSGKGATPIMAKPPVASTCIETQQKRSSLVTVTRTTVATGTAATPMMYPKPRPASGILLPPPPLDASININKNNNNNNVAVAINVGDYVNVRADFSHGFYSRGGDGYVACKESSVNGIDFVFTVAFVEAFLSGGQLLNVAESNITGDRLTVLPPSPFLALGPKQGTITAPTPQMLSGDTRIHGLRLLTPAATTATAELKGLTDQFAVQPPASAFASAPFSAGRPKRKGSTFAAQSQSSEEDDNADDTNNTLCSLPKRLSGHENLAEYLQNEHSLGRPKGWRQDDFGDLDLAVASIKRELLLQDVIWMEQYLNHKGRRKGPKQRKGGTTINSNSFVRNKTNNNSSNNNDDMDNSNRSEKIHPLTMRYLAYSWGVGKNTPKELLKRVNFCPGRGAAPFGSSTTLEPWKQRSVIECRKTALKHYSAKHLYTRHRIIEGRRLNMHNEHEKYNEDDNDDNDNDDASSSESCVTYQHRKNAKEEWDALDEAAREPWEKSSKWHDEMQPTIQKILVDQMNNHPYRTYDQLAVDIGNWCGASTIQRWLTARRDRRRLYYSSGTLKV